MKFTLCRAGYNGFSISSRIVTCAFLISSITLACIAYRFQEQRYLQRGIISASLDQATMEHVQRPNTYRVSSACMLECYPTPRAAYSKPCHVEGYPSFGRARRCSAIRSSSSRWLVGGRSPSGGYDTYFRLFTMYVTIASFQNSDAVTMGVTTKSVNLKFSMMIV